MGGEHPWIASVYYSFDDALNLYFLSAPTTLHARQIEKNPQVAVSIADLHQKPSELKQGLQLWGEAKQISQAAKVKHALRLWKQNLSVEDPKLTYENMKKGLVTGRMYRITPKMIKLFDQERFDVPDGEEPVLLL